MERRIVAITGAARGIGLEIARAFALAGDEVLLCDLDGTGAEEAAGKLRKEGLHAAGMRVDVASEADLDAAISYAMAQHGRLDVWINNAGMQHIAPIEHFPTAKFEQMIQVMLVAPFMATKLLFPIMKQQGGGAILNMASINGLVGFAGKAAYNSAKHGVIGLTRVAALEGAPCGITVNALCPGYVDTPLVRGQLADLAAMRGVSVEQVLEEVIYPLVPQRRLLDAAEVAAYALFLCGPAAKGITGQAAAIDGGYTVQ